MNNEIGLLVKDIPKDDLQKFIKKTKSNTKAHKIIDKVSVDYSWVDVLDEAIPCLDTIIRNPRRFIVSEEDIVPIEKTKKVSEESIKHLAVHTQLIQEVDEKGMVKPIKLLNVFKEETIDLYENRFLFSLINNLYSFVRNQLTYKDEQSSNKEESTLEYTGDTDVDNQLVSITVSMKCKNKDENLCLDPSILAERESKINHIREVLEDFKASKFMKAMASATPVRSPIRKTNVILKEQNFIKALSLWEFLENYQIQKPVKTYKEDKELSSTELNKKMDMSYFLNYCILSGKISKSGIEASPIGTNIPKMVEEYAKKFDVNENTLKEQIINEINTATKYKQEQIAGINAAYNSFVDNHYNRISKASLLFR